MEDDVSQAAVSAIAALQQKLKGLEKENQSLRSEYEGLRQRTLSVTSSYSKREFELSEATDKAQRIVNDSTAAISQIRNERSKNSGYKSRISQIEAEMGEIVPRYKKTNERISKVSRELTRMEEILSEYEQFLPKLLSTPEHNAKSSKSYDVDLLPSPLCSIVKRLHQLPSDFANQDFEIKRSTVQGILCVREALQDVNRQIYDLQKKKSGSITPRIIGIDIQNLTTQRDILASEISRFKFD